MTITLPTPEEIHDAYQAGEEPVQQLFATVIVQVEQVVSHLQELHDVIQQPQDQVYGLKARGNGCMWRVPLN